MKKEIKQKRSSRLCFTIITLGRWFGLRDNRWISIARYLHRSMQIVRCLFSTGNNFSGKNIVAVFIHTALIAAGWFNKNINLIVLVWALISQRMHCEILCGVLIPSSLRSNSKTQNHGTLQYAVKDYTTWKKFMCTSSGLNPTKIDGYFCRGGFSSDFNIDKRFPRFSWKSIWSLQRYCHIDVISIKHFKKIWNQCISLSYRH